MSQFIESAIARWLTSSSPDPAVAKEAWYHGRPAMLRTGGAYDAVRMPWMLVHAAAESSVPNVVAGVLAEVLDGPVICHPGVWYYALVPPGTCETWRCTEAVVRGRGGWLGIPRPDRTEAASVNPYWAVPVQQVGTLCAPDEVAKLLRVGRARVEDVGTEQGGHGGPFHRDTHGYWPRRTDEKP
ncbi:hypothetical protein ACIRQP_11655 [Streptomyces sp. NPDC102274]|uniref:hypothetical protein n=1 Tax=Streptomyces sp. NPDC102274 TaxID=3366151 RepID=UPI0037FFE7A1